MLEGQSPQGVKEDFQSFKSLPRSLWYNISSPCLMRMRKKIGDTYINIHILQSFPQPAEVNYSPFYGGETESKTLSNSSTYDRSGVLTWDVWLWVSVLINLLYLSDNCVWSSDLRKSSVNLVNKGLQESQGMGRESGRHLGWTECKRSLAGAPHGRGLIRL